MIREIPEFHFLTASARLLLPSAGTVDEVLNGYNCTIFAYGTTGTGKTFTMEGPPGSFAAPSPTQSASDRIKSQMEAGIIARSVQEIFDRLDKSTAEYSVRVSHLELYNEDLCDLLSPNGEQLKLLEDPRLGVQVHNLAEIPVYNPQDIFNILEKSYSERATAETDYNLRSSRSHCVCSITIHIKESTTEGEDLIKVGKLNMVDLAGSENIGRSGADRDWTRKHEAGNINKSLLTLGRVITALTEGQMHIPYRESKLTRLLQDSLGGRTKTCIIATISPSSGNLEETMSTLEYAFRAKNIKNRPEVNQKMAKREVIKEYTCEINQLRAQLDCMRRKDGVYLPTDEYERMIKESRELQEQVSLIEETLKAKERAFEEMQELFNRKAKHAEKVEKKLAETETVLDKTKSELTHTTGALVATRIDLDENKHLVQEYQKSESMLSGEATEVLDELKSAVEDTRGLFDKIDRKSGLHSKNVERTSELRVQMMADLSQAADELRSFTRGVSEALSTIDCEVRDTLSNSHVKSVQAAQRQLLNLQDEQSQRIQSWGEEMAKFAGKNRSVLEKMAKTTQSTLSAFETLQKQHAEARMTAWSEIDAAEDNFAAQGMEKWATQRIKSADDLATSVSAFAARSQASLSSMDSKVTYFTSGQSAQLVAQENALQRYMDNQREQFDKFRVTFVAAVTATMEEFFGERLSETQSALDEVRSQLVKSVGGSDAFQSDFAKWSTQEQTNAAIFAEDSSDTITEWKRAVGAHVTVFESWRSDAKEAREMLERQLSKHASAELSRVSEHTKAITKATEEQLEATSAQEVDGETRIVDLESNLNEKREILASTLGEHLTHLNRDANAMVEMVTATKEAVETFESEAIERTNSEKNRMADFSLSEYQATGITPVKRPFRIPSTFTHTKPHVDILAEYRKTAAYIEKHGENGTSHASIFAGDRPITPSTSTHQLHAVDSFDSLNSSIGPLSPASEKGSVTRSPSNGLTGSTSSLNASTGLPGSMPSGNLNTIAPAPTAAPVQKQTIQIINGRAIPPAKSTAAPAAKRTTSNLASKPLAGKTTTSTAAAKKVSTIQKKTMGAPVIHGPPLSEVNR